MSVSPANAMVEADVVVEAIVEDAAAVDGNAVKVATMEEDTIEEAAEEEAIVEEVEESGCDFASESFAMILSKEGTRMQWGDLVDETST